MRWSNIKWIYLREIRDQLRDRRTIFAILVLPVLMYPLMGMMFLQITQFIQEHPTKILVTGTDFLPADPPLLEGDRFSSEYCDQEERKLLELTIEPRPRAGDVTAVREEAEQLIQSGDEPLYSVADKCGFRNYRQLTSTFKKVEGMLPRTYREVCEKT